MDVASDTKQLEVIPDALMSVGKDEMNLIEIPLSQICRRRTADDKKTFIVERVRKDVETGGMVTRTVIVTGSDAFGLPLPCDDVVTIGLVSQTMQQAQRLGELSAKVYFSRTGLCREIGWSPSGRNLTKLEASLDRLSGVRVKTKNAWWDKGENEWKSHNFGIIDNYELCDKGRYDRKRPKGQREFPMCYFIWNDVPFKSFADGFVKSIDMNLFRAVNSSAVALRLYRLADKRFHFADEFDIPLQVLSLEHLALSAKYAPSQMKREIERGYNRLVEQKYLVDIPFEQRYIKKNDEWRVFFAKTKRSSAKAIVRKVADHESNGGNGESQLTGLAKELDERGVSPHEFVGKPKYSDETIREAIEVHDELVARNDPKVSENPPGYLASYLRNGWKPHKGFKTKAERKAQQVKRAATRKAKGEAVAAEARRRTEENEAAERRFREFMEALGSDSEREAFRQRALENANTFAMQQYRRAMKSNPDSAGLYLDVILQAQMEKEVFAEV